MIIVSVVLFIVFIAMAVVGVVLELENLGVII